ncbi:hypothetical protein CISG_07721 [Coccidioides immitis RMSCC 3703]|uniref:AB hydrolase-1 domain-containing protein n=2 Tax=Coccidioides immitis TaxID=5501 RepID=A0A0J8R4D6_COCIT|nr:hypothetical protein CIRG_06512 [Coccidioides immitis RMSCC 2394]KMU79290.1 hypothetical protein CISG_07721 [Coccidioides immitis RMSCC 3703]
MIPAVLQPALAAIPAAINADLEFQTSANGVTAKFAIQDAGSETALQISIHDGLVTEAQIAQPAGDAEFTLSARQDDWKEFFAAVPRAPWQSYWGMLRVLGHNPDMQVLGDMASFIRHARLWRISLDRIRDAIHSRPLSADHVEYEEITEEDSIIGRYVWLDSVGWGKSKVFCESAGTGPQHVLFLHTAGADSRQFHALMNNRELQQRCTMFAFDLPGHGRSYPGSETQPEGFVNDEEQYVSAIKQVIEKLKLHRPIVSGASMGGQVCLAVALRAEELGVSGVIPCEACDHLPLTQPIYHLPGDQNEAILNAERVCGMISPTAPMSNRKLIWWIYSSQAVQMFHGDLKFYFQGWDGRDRMHLINTKICPVYMLTGVYDYSCTPELSRETACKIPGAKFEVMRDLGHFPMTENPTVFLEYFIKGLEHIKSAQ